MLKRALDVAGALAGLVFAAPLIAGTALAVRVGLGRPVLFRQMRVGQHGRPFKLVKFRSMREVTGPDGASLDDAERLTRLGRVLRASALDELPSLWNVLLGDMSLVGPRPLPVAYLARYTPEQARRHDVRPGLTGWAQIHGRNHVDWERRLALDVWYVDHRSFWLDLTILACTVAALSRVHEASAEGHATMPVFTGVQASSPMVTAGPARGRP